MFALTQCTHLSSVWIFVVELSLGDVVEEAGYDRFDMWIVSPEACRQLTCQIEHPSLSLHHSVNTLHTPQVEAINFVVIQLISPLSRELH